MRLSRLFPSYQGIPDPEIKGIADDSRAVRDDWLFAALRGTKGDGRAYIPDAIRLGAVAILAEPGTHIEAANIDRKAVLIVDENPRRALAKMAARFYVLQPAVIAAVTGTNGKTSSANFTQQIWSLLGLKAASLGTLGVRGGDVIRYASMTTPDPVSLHATLADLAASGVTHLAMEASSHGLHQSRLDGVRVSVAGFTNLSHDHLDYHGTMEEYLIAKVHLFSDILCEGGTAVLNADIPEYADLVERCGKRHIRIISYGRAGTDIRLLSVRALPHGQEIEIDVRGVSRKLSIPLIGAFQIMNILCAAGMAIADRADDPAWVERVLSVLPSLKGVQGRLQLVPGHPKGGAVYVDYAHTPDALENILNALRPHTAGRLVCVFGCGGDRDRAKRPVMGKIAAQLADLAIVTDDNPRSEEPARIRKAVMAGAESGAEGKMREIAGRREAIETAVREIGEGDVLVIAGKGHENGQIFADRTEPFDDVDEAKKAMGAGA